MSTPRTAAASAAARNLIDMHIDRREMGMKALSLVLGWTALNGFATEPEAKILLGRAGMLKRYAAQGYLKQIPLPPGLKSAPHFPHQHYFHLTEKGSLLVAMHISHLIGYGNLELRQRTYLHDFIGRIEAAWRIRTCGISTYIPEIRLLDLASPNQKQHDGHFVLLNGDRVGLEIEAADWKSGDKLARFAAQCLNSVTNNRVQRILVLVQSQRGIEHYAKPFLAGQSYFPEWVQESGRWWPRQSSKTVITPDLADKVKVDLILTEREVAEKLIPEATIFLGEYAREASIRDDLEAMTMMEQAGTLWSSPALLVADKIMHSAGQEGVDCVDG